MADRVWYVYGIVRADAALPDTPEGLEGAPLERVREGALDALGSRLDATVYGPAALEANTADLEWLGPRAIAHDRMLSWASDRAAVVPLPMFTMFSSIDAVRAMLRDRARALEAALARVSRGREYALRIWRVDAELLSHASELSPRLREMEQAAAGSPPGQRYLLERKLDAERKAELRVIAQTVAASVHEALATHAIEAERGAIQRAPAEGANGVMVLNSAFLVAADAFPAFQRRLSELVAEHNERGFRFDFTGPWPAYHFAHGAAGAA